MTPDVSIDPTAQAEPAIPSTAGLTTRVVKGSIWTLAGQVLPLFASLATTPAIIRLLGSEAYGVLILITLIPTYFSFSELGMSMASTRFASEAYARGDLEGEAKAIRTAGLIAIICSAVVAVPISVFAPDIIHQFIVPNELQHQAVLGLRICSATFVTAIICGVVNTAQLTRLRMDLNAAINGLSKVTASVGTVFVLYLGGGIVGAAIWFLVIGLINIAAHIAVSGRLLRQFLDISIDRRLIKPLLRFGAGLALSAVATVLLVNLEKLLVGRLVSVESLAFYTVAFTFASMAMTFSNAMLQSLVPAFSQLLSDERREQFNDLFVRSLKLNIVWLLPALAAMSIIARPFFSIWAGPDFGRESTLPFFVLVAGIFFSVVAVVPWASIVAVGRTDLIAKVQWIEVVPYALLAVLLIGRFGLIGAAAAWSIRAFVDAIVFLWFSRQIAATRTGLRRTLPAALFGIAVLSPPVIISVIYGSASLILIPMVPICILLYSVVTWRIFATPDERVFIKQKFSRKTFRVFAA